jgi:multiple sugar transport system permease protein
MDVSDVSAVGTARLPAVRQRAALRTFAHRKSTIAFLLTLPLLLIIALLVIYPALYSLKLATLNKSM